MVRRRRRGQKGRSISLEGFIRRHRHRPWWVVLGLVVALAIAAWADRAGWLLHGGDDVAKYDGRTFVVHRVVDGDTLDLDVADGKWRATRVRLWGINTPELAREEDGQPAERGAEEARLRTEALTKGQRVTLELERSRVRDRWGRLLAFVKLPDGTLLNEQLLAEGLAEADDRWPHRRVERFELLEDGARRAGLGLWEQEPQGR